MVGGDILQLRIFSRMEDGKGGVVGQNKPPRSEAGDRP